MSQKTEISELISDVREQVLYLQELGVGDLSVELPEGISPKSRVQSPKPEVSSGVPASVPTIPSKPLQSQTRGSRLASLPSLSERSQSAPLRGAGANGADGADGASVP
ncbi:MAG: hypothetical protein ACT4O9_15040, partial [Blastocatellia bacterium]